ncbi:uncharacterized protein isoform X2 [Choristoneura fumiferana]|uniref:uncharacterized protein isoform X2 n=1 Tax=Choristoneura fumiferana TaxID=7141 RepID=UPI003D157AFB
MQSPSCKIDIGHLEGVKNWSTWKFKASLLLRALTNTLMIIWTIMLFPHIISVVLLLVGVILENGWLMLPWLIISALMDILFGLVFLVSTLASLCLIIPMLVVDGYLHLVVLSYFLEIKG